MLEEASIMTSTLTLETKDPARLEDDAPRLERRGAPRFSSRDTAEIRWTEPDATVGRQTVLIVNASASGVALLTRSEIPVTIGSTITLRTDQYDAVGDIRHFKTAGRRHWLGVEVRDVQPR